MIDDPLLWNRKLSHACMHSIKKLSKQNLVTNLSQLNFSKDQIYNAC